MTYLDGQAWFEYLEVVFFGPGLVGLDHPADGVHLDEALLHQLAPVLLVGDGEGQVLRWLVVIMVSILMVL
mgnify:CR=1 FL=1